MVPIRGAVTGPPDERPGPDLPSAVVAVAAAFHLGDQPVRFHTFEELADDLIAVSDGQVLPR